MYRFGGMYWCNMQEINQFNKRKTTVYTKHFILSISKHVFDISSSQKYIQVKFGKIQMFSRLAEQADESNNKCTVN